MGRYVHHMPFAPGGEFVWNRAIVHNGAQVKAGEPVNKAAFTDVRLRQMYEARIIAPADALVPPPAYLENGRGKAEQLARELASEEGKSDASRNPVPPSAKRADAKRAAPAAKSAPAKKVSKSKSAPAGKRSGRRAA